MNLIWIKEYEDEKRIVRNKLQELSNKGMN